MGFVRQAMQLVLVSAGSVELIACLILRVRAACNKSGKEGRG